MDIRKYKKGDILLLDFNDIHSSSAGWISVSECLKETPAPCRAVGVYLGTNKEKELCLSSLTSLESDQHGIRIYIPIGTIFNHRKLK